MATIDFYVIALANSYYLQSSDTPTRDEPFLGTYTLNGGKL